MDFNETWHWSELYELKITIIKMDEIKPSSPCTSPSGDSSSPGHGHGAGFNDETETGEEELNDVQVQASSPPPQDHDYSERLPEEDEGTSRSRRNRNDSSDSDADGNIGSIIRKLLSEPSPSSSAPFFPQFKQTEGDEGYSFSRSNENPNPTTLKDLLATATGVQVQDRGPLTLTPAPERMRNDNWGTIAKRPLELTMSRPPPKRLRSVFGTELPPPPPLLPIWYVRRQAPITPNRFPFRFPLPPPPPLTPRPANYIPPPRPPTPEESEEEEDETIEVEVITLSD